MKSKTVLRSDLSSVSTELDLEAVNIDNRGKIKTEFKNNILSP